MKHPKMDRHLISHEDHELDYVAKKFGITRKQVRKALAESQSRSRRRVYAWIRQHYPQTNAGDFETLTA